jgi:hypothetical protein
MSPSLQWGEIALRLGLTVLVGLIIGYNRSKHGKATGMRTTLLVCPAASAAMIQVNLLLPTAGRPAGSFVMNDLMRLPLGILTGVGFIGGGAILRRDDIVVGVTTAATLWLVTVIGLCIGGGQIGLAATAIGLAARCGAEARRRPIVEGASRPAVDRVRCRHEPGRRCPAPDAGGGRPPGCRKPRHLARRSPRGAQVRGPPSPSRRRRRHSRCGVGACPAARRLMLRWDGLR